MLDDWPLSIFHLPSDTYDTSITLPFDKLVRICGIDADTTYGAVPPATANWALLVAQ